MDKAKKTVSFGPDKVHGEMVRPEEHFKEKAVPERSRVESPAKSKWEVFMLGFGTGKFPSKMELSDIKSRQLRQQTTNTESDGGVDESDRRKSEKKRWWLLIDVFGCGGGYKGDVGVKDFQASFPTLKKYD